MIVPGIVIDCNERFVTVKFSKKGACGSCSCKHRCVSESMSLFLSSDDCHILNISNKQSLHLNKYQIVGLEISDFFILKASIFVYFIPILISIVISVVIDILSKNEILSIIAFVLCIVILSFIFRIIPDRNVKLLYIKREP